MCDSVGFIRPCYPRRREYDVRVRLFVYNWETKDQKSLNLA